MIPDYKMSSSIAQAVQPIQSGNRIYVHGANAFPQALIDGLARRADELTDVEMVHLHANGRAFYADPKYADRFHHRALFVGPNLREAVDDGRASYVPIFLSDIPDLLRSRRLRIDIAFLHLSPPDNHGYCSFGTSVDAVTTAAAVARVRIAQINPQMPRTLGESFIHVRDLDRSVLVDEPIPELDLPAIDEVQALIGRNVAELIPDGATLQLGIGGVPNAVLASLKSHRDLGIHSEVISDGVVDLVEGGVVTGAQKTLNKGKIVAAFLNGTRRLYDFVDDNPMVEMRPLDYTNNTTVIGRMDRMVAINSALEMDLTGQVCAESIGTKIFSGVGGQMDFMRGAALSNGGLPIIAMAATAKGGSISRIVPSLQPGAGITTTRAHVHYVVTEYGCANLHGLDLEERARAMIGLAAPEFRDDLESAARRLCFIRQAR